MKCQWNKELECEDLHVKMELTWFWKWLLFLFRCCFYFPHARKKIQNTSCGFAKGVLSLLSKLHANRTLLHREKILASLWLQEDIPYTDKIKANSAMCFLALSSLEMVTFKKEEILFVFLLYFTYWMFHC